MRNIIAIFLNYIELIFWYASIYMALSFYKPAEFNVFLTAPLAFILSFSTISTVGYGNVAPQGMLASLLSAAQAVTVVMALSSVVGSLINLSASPNQDGHEAEQQEPEVVALEAPRLQKNSIVWLLQRGIAFAVFLGLSFRLLTDGSVTNLMRMTRYEEWLGFLDAVYDMIVSFAI